MLVINEIREELEKHFDEVWIELSHPLLIIVNSENIYSSFNYDLDELVQLKERGSLQDAIEKMKFIAIGEINAKKTERKVKATEHVINEINNMKPGDLLKIHGRMLHEYFEINRDQNKRESPMDALVKWISFAEHHYNVDIRSDAFENMYYILKE